MEQIVHTLEVELEAALAEIAKEKNNVLRYDRSVKMVREIIDRLKVQLQAHPFPGKSEEIRYFKELAPKIYSRLFYFMKLYQVESYRPYTGREKFREVLEEELKGIERFYEQHSDICRYYHQHVSYWDDHLFTRRGQGEWAADEAGIFIDPDFCMGSYWASWILANGRYKEWLLMEQARLVQEEAVPKLAFQPSAKLVWKRSDTDLVEMIYGNYLAGGFGDATLKEVFDWFQEAFGIDLGRYYNTWQEIARRKKGPTQYTDVVREGLVKKARENLD